jgi:TM2 domain-containing membrane protein YozV
MRENKIIKKTYYCILFIFVIYLSYNYIYYYKERIANSDDFFPFIILLNTIL